MIDSRVETYKHIAQVQSNMHKVIVNLMSRALVHDASKLVSPEVEVFDEHTEKLAEYQYGTPGYQTSLDAIKPALDHHYANNSHHAEHFPNGIYDMSLMDIMEMLVDWKAATARNKNGNILMSLEHNKKRYNISDQLYNILLNTINELGLR